jgi:hypothetical protein
MMAAFMRHGSIKERYGKARIDRRAPVTDYETIEFAHSRR